MTQPATALRIPESMGPVEIGPYLRELREYFNLTPQNVSERLHIRTRYVTAIEEGRFELMPGKVYARGYVHSYAEFLGLDADQVVAQCFGVEKTESNVVQAVFVPKTAASKSRLSGGDWRSLGVLAVFAILGLVLYTQLAATTSETKTAAAPAVAPVPESMLDSMRSIVMPTARNHSCLTGNLFLSCFFAENSVQKIFALEADEPFLNASDFNQVRTPADEVSDDIRNDEKAATDKIDTNDEGHEVAEPAPPKPHPAKKPVVRPIFRHAPPSAPPPSPAWTESDPDE